MPRLLWVENHDQFTRYAKSLLVGYEVVVVPSLDAARAALRESSFAVVLVDYDLDDGKGTELVRELARLRERPVIVAASAHEDGNTALMAAGADASCPKLKFAGIADVLGSLVKSNVTRAP